MAAQAVGFERSLANRRPNNNLTPRAAMEPWKIALLVALGLLLITATVWLVHRRRSTWQRFARRKGLLYRETDEGPHAQGVIDGLPFVLSMAEDSSDTGALGVEEVRMSVHLPCTIPEGLAIHRAALMEHAIREVTVGEPFATQDEAFDQHFVVETTDPEAARQFLNEARRRALLQLVELPSSCNAGLECKELFCQDREMVASYERLNEHSATLLSVARALCQAETANAVAAR